MAVPRHQVLADDIRALIASGEWPPGTLLPTRAQFLHDHGISISTYTAAITALRAEGLISRAAERGRLVVESRTPAIAINTDDGEEAWENACQHAGVDGELRLVEAVRGPANAGVAEAFGIRRGAPIVQHLSHAVLDEKPVMVETRTRRRDLQDAAVVEAADVISSRPATRDELDLLKMRPGASVLVIDWIGYDDEGREVELLSRVANPLRVQVQRHRTRLPRK